MEMPSSKVLRAKFLCEMFRLFLQGYIYDRWSWVGFQKRLQLWEGFFLGVIRLRVEVQIRSVSRRSKEPRVRNVKGFADVLCDCRCRGCSQAYDSLSFDLSGKASNLQIVWSECVACIALVQVRSQQHQQHTPFRDTMSFIDSKESYTTSDIGHVGNEALVVQSFRCTI